MAEIAALTRQVQVLQAAMARANGQAALNSGVARGLGNLTQTKQLWDMELRHHDKMISQLQKRKMSLQEARVIQGQMNQLVQQQIRMQNSTMKTLPGGASMMMVPPQSAIQGTTSAMKQMQMQMGLQGRMLGALGTQWVDWGKNMQWAGRQLMVGFTVPFAAAAAAAGVYYYQIDKLMVQIEKVYNGSTEGLRQMAIDTGKIVTESLGGSMKDTLTVMGQLAAIGQTGNDLERATIETMRLSVLGDMDKETSLKAVVAMQATFQMSTEELANTINYMNQIENETSLSMQDFAEAIPRAAAPIANLGGSMQDLSLLMVAMKERGVDAGEGANAIKTLMTRMLNPTKRMVDQFEALTGGSLPELVKQANGELIPTIMAISGAMKDANLNAFEQQQLLARLGGAYQVTRLSAMFQGLTGDSEQIASALRVQQMSANELFLSAFAETSKVVNSASGKFKIAMESFKVQWLEFGELALKVGTAIIVGIDKMLGLFNGLPDAIKISILGFFAFTAVGAVFLMLIGLTGNLVGNITRLAGWAMRLVGAYKPLTLAQKGQELQLQNLNTKYLSQGQATQVLIFQLEKLRLAYLSVGQAQAMAAAGVHPSVIAATGKPMTQGGVTTLANGTMVRSYQGAQGQMHTRAVDPATGRFAGKLSAAEQKEMNGLLAAQNKSQQDTANATQRAGVAQRFFNSGMASGVGFAALLAGSMMGADSAMGKVLITTGLFLTLITLMGPALMTAWVFMKVNIQAAMFILVGRARLVAGSIAAWGAASNIAAIRMTTSMLTGMGTIAVVGRAVATGLRTAFSAIFGPIGLAIAAVGALLYGWYKIQKADEIAAMERQRALANSADGWATALGKNAAKWGEIRDESGKVVENMRAIEAAQGEKNKVVVDSFANTADPNQLYDQVKDQLYVLQGQGFGQAEVEESMRAALRAAGKTKDQINEIFRRIQIDFDLVDGQKDLNTFALDVRKDMENIFKPGAQGRHSLMTEMFGTSEMEYNTTWGGTQLDVLGGQIEDRLTAMDPSQKAIYAARITQEWRETLATAFEDLEDDIGADVGGNLWGALDKYTDKGMDGRYTVKSDFRTGDGDASLEELERVAQLGNAQRQLFRAIAATAGLQDGIGNTATDLGQVFEALDVKALNTADTVTLYEEALANAQTGTEELSEEQTMEIAKLYALAGNLDAATLARGGYNLSLEDGTNATQEEIDMHNALITSFEQLGATMEEISSGNYGAELFESNDFGELGEDAAAQAQALMDSTKSAMTGAQNDMLDAASDIAEQAYNDRMDRISEVYEGKKEALDRESKALDKTWESRMDAFKDRWEGVMDASKRSFEGRRKAIEDQAQAEEDAIDRQIEGIEKQKEADQEKEEQRQRNFEAEEKRLQRLNELRQGGIDYNRAMAEGNLDEASRVSGNMSTTVSSWANEDAQAAAGLAAEGRQKGMDDQIDTLRGRKDEIQERKDAKLEALREEEEAVRASLERQKEMEQRSLEEQKEREKERLQNRIDSLQKEQRAKEETERKKYEAAKKSIENELATLRAFIPRNEAELNAHKTRVEQTYQRYGIVLTDHGNQWGGIVGNSLQHNVAIARASMANANDWSHFGRVTADAITQGAFGMSIGDFWNTIVTGKLPERWQSPGGAARPGGRNNGSNYLREGVTGGRHAGGLIDSDPGTRAGRTGGLKKGERKIVALDGEYMLQKSVVDRLGPSTLDALNSGKIGLGGPEAIGYSGIGMAMGAMMLREMIEAAFFSAADPGPEEGFGGSIGLKPGMFAGVNLSQEQLINANTIANVGKQLGASARDIQIALMTAMQESTLRNINYGDRDSLGLFQQRAPWGSAAERTNPAIAARMFFLGGKGGQPGLFSKRNRNMMTLAQAAQAVQVSAFPGAYAKWEAMAAALMGGGIGNGALGAGTGLGLFGRAFQQIAGGGGPGVQNALAWARTQHGKPYQWGGGGNPSWDCSGFMSGIAKAILGENPNGHPFSTHSFKAGRPGPMGFMPGLGSPNGFSVGVKHGNPGHMAGTLGGVNVESAGGGKGVRVGDGAWGATNPYFNMFFHLPAAGAGPGLGGTPIGMPSNYDAYNKPKGSEDFDGRLIKPAQGPVVSEYGARIDPMTGKEQQAHHGTDIGAREGSPIRSIAAGEVIKAEYDRKGFGNFVLVMHPGGLISGYAHQSAMNVKVGDTVNPGQTIGKVGATGNVTGPHLHLQLTDTDGKFLDPRAFIPSLRVGGNIKFDDTLANLHAGETVLTSPLSSALERGIKNLDSGGSTTYNTYEIKIEGSNLTAEQVVGEIDRKKMIAEKRRGAIR